MFCLYCNAAFDGELQNHGGISLCPNCVNHLGRCNNCGQVCMPNKSVCHICINDPAVLRHRCTICFKRTNNINRIIGGEESVCDDCIKQLVGNPAVGSCESCGKTIISLVTKTSEQDVYTLLCMRCSIDHVCQKCKEPLFDAVFEAELCWPCAAWRRLFVLLLAISLGLVSREDGGQDL